MQLIDGKALSQTIKEEIAQEVEQIKKNGGKIPHLAAVLIGEDPASEVYVRNKVNEFANYEPPSLSLSDLLEVAETFEMKGSYCSERYSSTCLSVYFITILQIYEIKTTIPN